MPQTNKYQQIDTPRQRQQDQTKMSSTPCADTSSTPSKPTQQGYPAQNVNGNTIPQPILPSKRHGVGTPPK
jgi:hypothetical protein